MNYSKWQHPGTHREHIVCDESERSYLVHVPNQKMPAAGWALVFAFHGSGSSGEDMADFSGLISKAEAASFVVVFPDGSGRIPSARTWNAGHCCGYAHRHQVDDVKFVTMMLDALTEELNIDSTRIFATGMSNGAMLCYLLADELSDRFAAIAAVAGTMGAATCSPTRAIPILHFHGTDDEFVLCDGGHGRRSISRADFYSVSHTLHHWVQANRANVTPETTRLNGPVDDGTWIEKSCYRKIEDNSADVILYTIHNGGHTWPGHENNYPFLGKVTQNLDANDVIWDFFQANPMP
ncbi:MAG: polyhydroxybutyrate depolymerase [Blastopirellula sp.]|nr:MAG: polyhydroxybutyrate depolymerase [Blastopirellula sp.]